MDRRAFGRIAGGVIMASAGIARAQRPGKVYQVGYLANQIPLVDMQKGAASPEPQIANFVEDMRKLGWEEGRNVRYLWRSAEGHLDRRQERAAELVRMNVDVIVAFGIGAEAAARVTRTIPIVMANTYWPVERGLARSFASPGGNVTGLAMPDSNETVSKQLDLMKQIAPHLTRIALVTQARGEAADRYPGHPGILQHPQFTQPAKALKLELSLLTYGDPSSLPEVMRSAVRQGAQAINFDDNPPFHFRETQEMIAAEARRLRVLIALPILSATENGVLMAYGIDHQAALRRLPYYVNRILRGDKPGVIPIETPAKVELHINLGAARAIGLEIPRSVLLQADRVI